MRSVFLIAVGLAAVVVALFLTVFSDEDTVDTVPQTTSAPEQSAPKTPTPQPRENIVKSIAPSFDVVRINPEGDAVIAGRATPGVSISIMDGDTLLGTVKADERGEWVYLPTQPLDSGERELSLRAKNPDGQVVESEDVVVLVVPESKKDTLALSMSKDGQGGVSALQVPGEEAIALSIGAVNYDEAGKLSISGQAPEGGAVFLYLDGDFLGHTQADDRGQWSLSPTKTVAPGVYELRADHVDEYQKVLNRVSIPFSRADEEALKEVAKDDRKIIVQPGNSLWRIARRVYGSGFDYAVIYRANKGQIVDPDLIYPGQILEVPEGR